MRLRLAISCWLLASVSLAQSDIWRQDSVQEVVITGTGTQHLLKDAPVQTEVISHRQLQQYAGRSIEDILSGERYGLPSADEWSGQFVCAHSD